jgi:hypothetical protein
MDPGFRRDDRTSYLISGGSITPRPVKKQDKQGGGVKVLLIFNNGESHDFKMVVRLQTEDLILRVNRLMAQSRGREAFDLILSSAEVEDYIPPGHKVKIRPALTLIEDIL